MILPLLSTLCVSQASHDKRVVPSRVPDFALAYAPVAYLHSEEKYQPADIGSQLDHTQPEVNFTSISNTTGTLTLNNLDLLNDYGHGGEDVYLTSVDNVEDNPSWLYGVTPDSNGLTDGAMSSAILVNDHGSGLVDVFYFYFYAFDFGGVYFGRNIGNHVGDWEHTMVRFQNGEPQATWYSQHSNGEAFTYSATEKYDGGIRPVVYIANGTHANYAITGAHDHTIPDVNLPNGPVEDYTDESSFWDPTLSAYFFSYDASTKKFTAYDSSTPVNWLYYLGQWGDKQYPDSNPRQEDVLNILGLYKYTNGPMGPEDKQLNRTNVCPDNGDICIVRPILGP